VHIGKTGNRYCVLFVYERGRRACLDFCNPSVGRFDAHVVRPTLRQ
jgi:hypothetical protein